MSKPILKPIPNFTDYYAGNDGNIYTTKPLSPTAKSKTKPRILKPNLNKKTKYFQISLWNNGKCYCFNLHKLILLTWHGKPNGLESRHLDGKRYNNRPSNLKYGTRLENYNDRKKHGMDCYGERNGMSKLNELQIRIIRRLYKRMPQLWLGKIFKISQSVISGIQTGKEWKYLVESKRL